MGVRRSKVAVQVWLRPGVRLERYLYSAGYEPGIAEHAHDELQLCYSGDGYGAYKLGTSWREARPGRVYVFPARMEHTGAREAELPCGATYDVLYIDTGRYAVDRGVGDIGSVGAGRATRAKRELASTAAFVRLCRALCGRAGEGAIEDRVVGVLAGLRIERRVERWDGALAGRVRDVLRGSPAVFPGLGSLSRELGASVFQIREAFKAAFGVAPVRYHTMLRLQSARLLLLDGVSPSSVARRCGFVDQAHLTRKLRRYCGHTPAGLAPGPLTIVQEGPVEGGLGFRNGPE